MCSIIMHKCHAGDADTLNYFADRGGKWQVGEEL